MCFFRPFVISSIYNLFNPQRDRKDKRAPLVFSPLDPDAPAMQCDKLFADVQTKAETLTAELDSGGLLVEPIENQGQAPLADSASGIAHGDAHEAGLIVDARPDSDFAALRKLERIVNQV